MTLATFGHHISHHLFPTIDHAVLPELSEIIFDTCREFEADLRIFPWYELIIGQFKQLRRVETRKMLLL
jgi:fatty acid desaturase